MANAHEKNIPNGYGLKGITENVENCARSSANRFPAEKQSRP